MGERPFRHLCPEADLRDRMTEDEFWQHVFANLPGPIDDIGHPDYDETNSLDATPCDECGEVGACAYDAMGRALIHASDDKDDS